MLSRLSYRSAGESHGAAITVLLEGLPRGLPLDLEAVNAELRRRQGGAGRSGRQRIEVDSVAVTAGLRHGRTLGTPLCLVVANRDATLESLPVPRRPRPGHADLAGCFRYLDHDIRATLERASARETVGRVAAGAIARQLLETVDCEVFGFVRSVGAERLPGRIARKLESADLPALRRQRDGSRLYTLDAAADTAMFEAVGQAGRDGDTLGGTVEVHALGVLPGLGSCLQWDQRLDARLVAAMVSIPAFKAAEIGLGFRASRRRGSRVHDPIRARPGRLPDRGDNNAGGLEGGMTNGAPVVVRGAMKPIATLRRPLASVDLETGAAVDAGYERSDVCAVAAASVVAEAMVLLVLADAALERVAGETLSAFRAAWVGRAEAGHRLLGQDPAPA